MRAAWETYRGNAVLTGMFPGLDESDFDTMARYLWRPRDGPIDVWVEIEGGGHLGASLVVHELAELQKFFELGANPWDAADHREHYPFAHGFGSLAEGDYLLAVAPPGEYNLEDVGPLLLESPTVGERGLRRRWRTGSGQGTSGRP